MTSREFRIRVSDYALTFSQTVELAADSILALATERTVARNALVWKTYAVPAVYRSATLSDPLWRCSPSTWGRTRCRACRPWGA